MPPDVAGEVLEKLKANNSRDGNVVSSGEVPTNNIQGMARCP
jgi:hypothetical protein